MVNMTDRAEPVAGAPMPDPLAGIREKINRGDLDTLLWPDEGKGCPVEVGDVFQLRSCSIEITGTRRVQRGRSEWLWRATFRRVYRSGRIYLLAARGAGDEGHGYVSEDKAALSSGEERPDWDPVEGDRVPVGPPPEPEAIPPHEVRDLPTSVAARARFAEQRLDIDAKRAERSISHELRQALAEARKRGEDVTPVVERVREQIRELKGNGERVA